YRGFEVSEVVALVVVG
nr:hypothetical protein [Tanacetum cinerariifolium]